MKTINHECYVSLEVAELLKEAGFDWEVCDGYIIYEDGHVFTTNFQTPYNFNGDNKDLFSSYRGHKGVFSKPTLDVAQRWLREVKMYNLIVNISINEDNPEIIDYEYFILTNDKTPIYNTDLYFNTYEEALESGIKKVLEIILEK